MLARTVLSLNGSWQIAESSASVATPDALAPEVFGSRSVAVPGLARFASPRFAGLTVAEIGWLSAEERQRTRPDPRRDYFWYRRVFTVAADQFAPVARLRFAKAQFGVRVWLNGHELGEQAACFSPLVFAATGALRVGENELVVRVGAHPGMLPPGVPAGSDTEKFLWTAGLYDEVSLLLSGTAVITGLQVAPRWSEGRFQVEWTVGNATAAPLVFTPRLRLGALVSTGAPVQLAAGESVTLKDTLTPAEPRAWSPEDPFLHELRVDTGDAPEVGDARVVKVGLREFRFDAVSRRAWLNGRIVFLRGTNLTLHRFFEDEACGDLPWTEAWSRRLLVDLPRELHWNSMRWSLGPAPERWLELADEAGLLIEYEFPIWNWRADWKHETVREHVAAWMAGAWNHPSVAWWSLSNETHHAPLVNMVGELRGLDLAARPWNNGYNLPQGPHDPVDDHIYLMHGPNPWGAANAPLANAATYEKGTAAKTANSPHPCVQPTVVNEYCWAWLRRDDSCTELTQGVYARYFAGCHPAERRRLYADLLAAETEYFRAHRNFAGVLHFSALTCDHPWSMTGDLFRDVVTLELQPDHAASLAHAFHPAGVYLNFWQSHVAASATPQLDAMVMNDGHERLVGELEFAWHLAPPEGFRASIHALGERWAAETRSVAVEPLCVFTARCNTLRAPATGGDHVLVVTLRLPDGTSTTSRRRVRVC